MQVNIVHYFLVILVHGHNEFKTNNEIGFKTKQIYYLLDISLQINS